MRNQDLVAVCLGFFFMENKLVVYKRWVPLEKETKRKTNAAFCEMKNVNVGPEQVLSEADAGVKSRRRKNKASVQRGGGWRRSRGGFPAL